MRRLIFLIIAFGLVISQSSAATPAETRAYNNALDAFRAGIWDRAEKEFGSFAAKYPTSTNTPEAILRQARARAQLGRQAEATELLLANAPMAGGLAHEYLFWTAEIYFQRTNYADAARAFARLTTEFPKSTHRLEAALGEAASNARLERWPRVVELLDDPKGAFQSAASADPTNEFVFRGGLLLAQAQLAQKNFPAAEAVLNKLADQSASPPLKWQRVYSLSRVQLADDRAEDALRTANDLVALAGSGELRAQSVEMRAAILQQLHHEDEAIVAYRQNLAADVPLPHQQQALFKMAELSLWLGRIDDATHSLETFLLQNTNSPVADVVWFTLGDMQLRQYLAGLSTNGPADTATNFSGLNYLREAAWRFQMLREKFPASPLVGQALLNEGWCSWFTDDMPGSVRAFQAAARRLVSSDEQLVARFKWADSQGRLKDFVGAITNYEFVVSRASTSTDPRTRALVEPALYQLLRASFDASDVRTANDALAKILSWYPDGFIAPRALLMSGQGFTLRKDTAQARDQFSEFERRFPNSLFLPVARLGIARTYEQEGRWTNAIRQYDDWLATFTTNPDRSRVEYYRGWANFQAGNETNALMLFTNFVAQFPNDQLAPEARWWIADHYFREGDFVNAEKNYQLITEPGLAYQARLQAGRSAIARARYPDAVNYFTNLTSDANCPRDIWAQALFAYSDVQMMLDPGGTNKQANLRLAVQLLTQIPQTNSLYAPALGRIGDYYVQLAAWSPDRYELASNAYALAMEVPQADVATRSQAKVGLGMVAEKQAQQKTGEEQTTFLVMAFNNYNDVFFGKVSGAEKPDPFWTKYAGLDAARIAETLGYWVQAINIYQRLGQLLPPLQPMLDKKIAAARKSLEGSPE